MHRRLAKWQSGKNEQQFMQLVNVTREICSQMFVFSCFWIDMHKMMHYSQAESHVNDDCDDKLPQRDNKKTKRQERRKSILLRR